MGFPGGFIPGGNIGGMFRGGINLDEEWDMRNGM